jgi:hypothetical protein
VYDVPVAPGISVNTPVAPKADCHWNEVAAYLVKVNVISPPKHTDVAGAEITPALTVVMTNNAAESEVAVPQAPDTVTLYSVPAAGNVAVFKIFKVVKNSIKIPRYNFFNFKNILISKKLHFLPL